MHHKHHHIHSQLLMAQEMKMSRKITTKKMRETSSTPMSMNLIWRKKKWTKKMMESKGMHQKKMKREVTLELMKRKRVNHHDSQDKNKSTEGEKTIIVWISSQDKMRWRNREGWWIKWRTGIIEKVKRKENQVSQELMFLKLVPKMILPISRNRDDRNNAKMMVLRLGILNIVLPLMLIIQETSSITWTRIIDKRIQDNSRSQQSSRI